MIDAAKIEELRGLLAKATPGPWSTHLVDDTTIISPTREVATTCDSVQAEREDGYNIEYEQMEADAALIVAMRNALPALLDAAERLERQVRAKQQEIEEIAARAQENYKRALSAERLASRAREDALREASKVAAFGDLPQGLSGSTRDAVAKAILALIDKPKPLPAAPVDGGEDA